MSTEALDLVKAAQAFGAKDAKDALAAQPELNFLALALSGEEGALVLGHMSDEHLANCSG